MKKIISLILVFVRVLSVCGCALWGAVHLGSHDNALDPLSTGVRENFYALTVAMTDTGDIPFC
jgi:hypothetical protein